MRAPRAALLALVLLIVPTGLVSAAPADDGYALTDPAGDVRVSVAQTPSPLTVPDVDAAAYADITGLKIIDRDEETLDLVLTNMAGFKAPAAAGTTFICGCESFYHQIDLQVPGSTDTPASIIVQLTNLRLRTEGQANVKTDFATFYANACIGDAPDRPPPFGCFTAYVPMEIIDQAAVLHLPKLLLVQQGWDNAPSYFGPVNAARLRPQLVAGDRITGIHVTTAVGPPGGEGFTGIVDQSDRAPDSGAAPDFTLRYSTPTSDLKFQWTRTAVVAGEDNLLHVEVTNAAPVKRIVEFTAVEDSMGQGASWGASVTRRIILPSGESTNITLRVHPPPAKGDVSDYLRVRLRGDVLTQPGTVGVSSQYLHASPPFDAEHGTFYLHGQTYTILPPLPLLQFGNAYLRRTDARDPNGDSGVRFNSFGTTICCPPGGASARFYLNAYGFNDIPNPAKLQATPPTAHLEFSSSLAFSGQLRVEAWTDDVLVASQEGPITLPQGRSSKDLILAVAPGFTGFNDTQQTLRAQFTLTDDSPTAPAASFLGIASVHNVTLEALTTVLHIPVERDRSAALAADAPVVLAPAGPLDRFINPGHLAVAQFDLRNEGTNVANVTLSALNATHGWTTEVRPSERYRLPAGAAVRVGLVVRAPENANEGDTVHLRFQAEDTNLRSLLGASTVTFTVTRGVEIDNETFLARAEDASAVDTPTGHSPAPGLFATLLLIATVVAAASRRRPHG